MRELLRRLALAVGIAASLWLFFLADLTPLVSLRVPRNATPSGLALGPGLQGAPPARSLEVGGSEWEHFLEMVKSVSAGGAVPDAMTRRIPPFELHWDRGRDVYFRIDEPPMNEIAGLLAGDAAFRIFSGADPGLALDLRVTRLSNESFHPGTGLSDYGPPKAMVFPWRSHAWWLSALGFAAYLCIPKRRRGAGEMFYAPWRSYLGDLAWVMLFTLFYGLPLAIVGGSMQALLSQAVFPIVLWPLAGLGALLIWFMAWNASFGLCFSSQGFAMSALNQKATVNFSDITNVSTVVHVHPRWFIRLMWVASLFGRGTSGMRAAGQAMLLESSQVTGLEFCLRGGVKAYIWLTDSLGTSALAGGDTILEKLRAAGMRPAEGRRELVALFPPMMTDSAGVRRSWIPVLVALAIALVPSLVVLAAMMISGSG